MEFFLIAGMLLCGWVFLCVLSGERERRAAEITTETAEEERAKGEPPSRQSAEPDLRALLRANAAGGHGEKLTGNARPTTVD